MTIEPKTFICDACGKTCIPHMTEEESIAEYKKNFSKPFNKDEVSAICDDCYNKFMVWYRKKSSL